MYSDVVQFWNSDSYESAQAAISRFVDADYVHIVTRVSIRQFEDNPTKVSAFIDACSEHLCCAIAHIVNSFTPESSDYVMSKYQKLKLHDECNCNTH